MKEIRCIYDPLQELIAYYAKDKAAAKATIDESKITVEQKLKQRIIDGDKIGVDKDLEIALKKYSALQIINDHLLEGMKVVGSQAASSQMSVEETTAAIGTLVAVTQQGGSEMGNAFKGILMNLRQIKGNRLILSQY